MSNSCILLPRGQKDHHLVWGTKKWLWFPSSTIKTGWLTLQKKQHRYGQTTMKVDHVHWKPTGFRYRLVKLLEFKSLFLMVKSPRCIYIYIHIYIYILYLEPHFQYVGNHPVTFHFIPMNHPQLANPPFWCLEFHYMHDPFVQSLVNWSMGKPQQKVSVTRYIPIVLPHINLDPENNAIFLWKVIFRPKKLAGFTLIWGRVPRFPSCKLAIDVIRPTDTIGFPHLC